jgi:hypothetical protein
MFDLTNCYAAARRFSPANASHSERAMNVMLNVWCGVLLVAVATWLL